MPFKKRALTAVQLPLFLLAQSVFAQSPVFEEVIVTAEKRDESLQDLSQAVTALTSDDVEQRQLTSFVDLSAIAPGVNVAKNEGFKTVITVRGIGNEANQNAIANPSVSYHLDGVTSLHRLLCKPISWISSVSKCCVAHRAHCSVRTRRVVVST